MTCSGSSLATALPAAAYETLRAAVLSGRSSGQRGLAILTHRGLAAWIGEARAEPAPTPSSTVPIRSAEATIPTPGPNELTRVLAGIVLALSTGSTHARP
ncbi:MAG: hypothetical protein JO283_20810 [Bradyrhizobium sp.]|nr:hypothetical protein [Bradyrhizobium sp.]